MDDIMAHGLRAQSKQIGRRDYWGRRPGNQSGGTPRKSARHGRSGKALTHCRERRAAAADLQRLGPD